MAVWTEEMKEKAVEMYTKAEPTPATSTQLLTEIAEELEMTPNGVRQVLSQAGVYVKKDGAKGTKGTSSTKDPEKAPRVSKEDQINALKAAIEEAGAEVDEEILSKLTGKAAAYFVKVLST